MGYSPRQGFGSHGRILRPGRNRPPPLADSASVPAIGRHPSPLSTCAVIVTVLAVPALHTPASCQFAPPAFFTEDPSSTGVTPNFIRRVSRLGNIRERPCVRTRTLSHRRHGGTCLFPSALDLQHERALRPTATVGRRSTAPETVYHRPLAQSGANVPPWRPAMVVPTTSDPHRSHDMALAANQALMRVTGFTAIAIHGRGLWGARNPRGFGLTGTSDHAGAPERLSFLRLSFAFGFWSRRRHMPQPFRGSSGRTERRRGKFSGARDHPAHRRRPLLRPPFH